MKDRIIEDLLGNPSSVLAGAIREACDKRDLWSLNETVGRFSEVEGIDSLRAQALTVFVHTDLEAGQVLAGSLTSSVYTGDGWDEVEERHREIGPCD